MLHTLSKKEYYDVILKDSGYHQSTINITEIPPLVIAIYQWISDFTDRRGIRQTWDQLNEDAQEDFMNLSYNVLLKTVNSPQDITLSEINSLYYLLKKLPSMSHEIDMIDDDIIEEIKTTWLNIFNTQK